MKTTDQFLTRPALVPMPDGVNWHLAGPLRFELFDGTVITAPAGFQTDLASVPPLGVVGACIMAAASLLSLLTPWAWILYAAGFVVACCSAWIKTYGRYTYAAVIHDWLYRTHAAPFTVSNWILLVAMKSEKTACWERFLIWFNVQAFGFGIYNSDKRQRTAAHHKKVVTQ